MKHLLDTDTIKEIESKMTNVQLEFLDRNVKNTVYVSSLQKLLDTGKIRRIKDVELQDLYVMADKYILINRLEAPDGKRFECDEGHKNIKYLYIIKDIEDDKIIRLGSTCFKNLTGMTPTTINALVKLFDNIDLEYERILIGVKEGKIEKQKHLLDVKELPATILRQLSLGLPITDEQYHRIEKYVKAHKLKVMAIEEEKIRSIKLEQREKEILPMLNIHQMSYFESRSKAEKEFILLNFYERRINKKILRKPIEDFNRDIAAKLMLNMPLTETESYLVALADKKYRAEKRRESIKNNQTKRKQLVEWERKSSNIDYDEIIKEYGVSLNKIKAHIDDAKKVCPRSFNRLIDIVSQAKEGKMILRRVVRQEIDTICHALKI